MENRGDSRQHLVALGLTVLGAALRLVPHPPNFTPVGSVALFGGAKLRSWQAYLIPLVVMLATDPILSHLAGYSAFSIATPVIYLSFLINVLLGRAFLRKASGPGRVISVAALGSVQFFVVTNLFEWWFGIANYAHTAAGLLACFTAALPFFERTLLGDLFYSAVLFTAYAFLSRRVAQSPISADSLG